MELSNTNGSITIHHSDDADIHIIARKKVSAGNSSTAKKLLDDLQIDIDQVDDVLQIRTIYPRSQNRSGFFAWLFGQNGSGKSVQYEIAVPDSMEMEIHTTNGSIHMTDISGNFVLFTTNGKITAENIKGSLKAKSTNGAIYAALDVVNPDQDIRIRTTNGSIRLFLPGDINADLEARTTNGKISCELPLTETYAESRRRLEGRINEGGTAIFLRTTNGSIRIKEN